MWWQIALEPESRGRDVTLRAARRRGDRGGDAWTTREPQRAEAWFYLGAAYGARVQWRVLREQRLAAARDGKRIKEALERALTLDPSLHDAAFGLGMYRYYADIGPARPQMLRWLLLLPGGDREGGLRQIVDARDRGLLVRGEADYQLHLIYLWYEHRATDALTIVRGLQERYPRNPLFWQIEAEIQDVYFHDHAASLAAASRSAVALATDGRVNEAALAVGARAPANGDRARSPRQRTSRAIETLQSIVAERPARPYNVTTRAEAMLRSLKSRAK